jgi:hypothetical protein
MILILIPVHSGGGAIRTKGKFIGLIGKRHVNKRNLGEWDSET